MGGLLCLEQCWQILRGTKQLFTARPVVHASNTNASVLSPFSTVKRVGKEYIRRELDSYNRLKSHPVIVALV